MRLIVPGMLVALALLAAGCGGVSLNFAETAFAPTPPPPPGTPVAEGEIVALTPEALMAGNLIAGEEDRYTFTGEAGKAVTIRMDAAPGGWLDSYLELRSPDGATLITNDDRPGSLDSLIDNYVLPADGEYTILAYSFNHRSTGGYSLQISLGTPAPAPTVTPTPAPGGGPIAVGEIRSGAINAAGQVDQWELTGAAGEWIALEMRPVGVSYITPYLELVGPDGGIQRVGYASSNSWVAVIPNFQLPWSGTYIIRAAGAADTTGSYNLQAIRGAPPTATLPPPTPGPSPTPVVREIVFGEAVAGQIRPNTGGDTYTMRIEEPSVIEVLLQAESDVFNLYLELQPPFGSSETLVDYRNAAPMVYLPGLFLYSRGEYRFRLRAAESRFINYTFLVNRLDVTRQVAAELAYGQGMSGELVYPSQKDLWTFQGRAGDRVTIIMRGGSGLDSFLRLLDETGDVIASNDDMSGRGTLDSRIDRLRLPVDGMYTIVAGSYNDRSFGQYRLLLFKEGEG